MHALHLLSRVRLRGCDLIWMLLHRQHTYMNGFLHIYYRDAASSLRGLREKGALKMAVPRCAAKTDFRTEVPTYLLLPCRVSQDSRIYYRMGGSLPLTSPCCTCLS